MTNATAENAAPAETRKLPSSILFLMLPLVGFGIWTEYRAWQNERAIRSIPAVERQTIYQRTIDNYHALCSPVLRQELRERCREDADFLSLFPECDAQCLTLIGSQRAQPVR